MKKLWWVVLGVTCSITGYFLASYIHNVKVAQVNAATPVVVTYIVRGFVDSISYDNGQGGVNRIDVHACDVRPDKSETCPGFYKNEVNLNDGNFNWLKDVTIPSGQVAYVEAQCSSSPSCKVVTAIFYNHAIVERNEASGPYAIASASARN
jgi:hypothetical protein